MLRFSVFAIAPVLPAALSASLALPLTVFLAAAGAVGGVAAEAIAQTPPQPSAEPLLTPTPPRPAGSPAVPTSPDEPPTLRSAPLGPEAQRLSQTAQDQYARGDFDGARKTLESLLELQKQPQLRAETLNLIGLVQERLNQFDAAQASYQSALELYAQLKPSQPQLAQQGEARTLNNLGTLYAATERVSEALGFMERALGLFRQLNIRESEAITLRNLGSLYLRAGRGEDAIEALQASLAIETELERPVEIVGLLDRLSSLYLGAGAVNEALVALQQAYSLVEPSDDLESKLALLTRIAQLYEGIRRPDKAIKHYQDALKLVEASEALGNAQRPLEGRLRSRIAAVFAEAEQPQRAIAQYEKALAIAESLDQPLDRIELLTRMGDVQRRSQNYDRARNRYEAALELVQPLAQPILEGRLLSGLAAIAKDLEQWDQAQDYAQRALTAQQKNVEGEDAQQLQQAGQAVTLNLLGDLHQQQNQYEQAAAAYQQSLATLGTDGNVMLQGANLTNLGAMQVALGQDASAVQPLQRAIALWEALGLESAEGGDGDLVEASYRLLTAALLNQGKTEDALVAVEQRRSRLFRSLLDLRQGLQQGQRQAPGQQPTPSLTLQQIRAIARQAQTTLLFYDLAYAQNDSERPGSLRVWTVAADGAVTLKTTELTAPQQALLQSQETPATNKIDLVAWSELLLEPVQSSLLQARPVVIVAPPALQSLPWAALPLKNQPLLEQHLLTVVPSVRLLQATGATGGERDPGELGPDELKPLVLGDPATGRGRSPMAARSAAAVAELLGVEALTGEAATARAIATHLPRASLVHLAVPQLNVEGVGEALALAASGSRDLQGITPGDLLTLDLQANLVVLQGLRGNVDSPSTSELSLAQAFRAAGAGAVVQSLGGSDEAAQQVLERFYVNLRSGQTTGQALRQAMLSVRQQYPNPQDWAGFTLLGPMVQQVALPAPTADDRSVSDDPTPSP